MNVLTVFFGCFFNNKEMTCRKKYYRCVAKKPPKSCSTGEAAKTGHIIQNSLDR